MPRCDECAIHLTRACFAQQDAAGRGALAMFFRRQLQKALVTLMSDPVEKVREEAIGSLRAFASGPLLSEEDLRSLAAEVVPMAKGRIGVAPFGEPAEEIRLQLLSVSVC